MKLLGNDALERSDVVANCQMNRQRRLTGSNGYGKELRLNPVDFLLGRNAGKVRWLDMCCGEGVGCQDVTTAYRSAGASTETRIMTAGVFCPSGPIHSEHC